LKPNALTIRFTFLGGAFGTLLRFGIWAIAGDLVAVVVVNLVGAALIGWFNGNKNTDTDSFNALWKIGFAGGFTTMSSFASLIVLFTNGIGVLAIIYALLITAAGLGAYWLAFMISRKRATA
jgi:CrcB protein